jgi:hypothetical protein
LENLLPALLGLFINLGRYEERQPHGLRRELPASARALSHNPCCVPHSPASYDGLSRLTPGWTSFSAQGLCGSDALEFKTVGGVWLVRNSALGHTHYPHGAGP